MIKECPVCGKSFLLDYPRRKYCSPECKEIGIQNWRRAYYEKNKDRTKENYKKNRDKISVYMKQYYREHKEERHQYYLDHKEEFKKRKKSYALRACQKAHDNCFSCPEEVGYCPYD